MKLVTWALLSGILLFVCTGNAFANSLKEVRTTLESGNYDLAVELGSALGSTGGLVLAAEALNAKLLLGEAKRNTKTAKQAMKLAQAALVVEPKNAEAQLQYALAYGFYGRHVSSFTAWRKNLPKKIKIEIDKAAALNPKDARVEALKGAWHLNLLYRAKGFDVKKRYGANEREGIAYFQKALASTQNQDIIISSSFLMLQYVLDPEARADQTKLLLQTVILTKKPSNAVERQVMDQMRGIYAGFVTGDSLELAEEFVNQ